MNRNVKPVEIAFRAELGAQFMESSSITSAAKCGQKAFRNEERKPKKDAGAADGTT